MGVCVPIIIGLFYFVMRDYLDGKEMNFENLTIFICALGGPAILYLEWKAVRGD